jgi:hypothetical protein
MHQSHSFTLAIQLMAATGTFAYRRFDFLFGLTGAFLDATNQLIFFSFDELQIIVGQLRQLLFHFALGDVPVSFGCKRAHIIFVFFCHAVQHGAKILFASGVPSF